ncbi:hypothetical protein GTP27_06300 [Pseudoduganella sp. CY13W]|uniref:DUF3999 family protein n=1 Tax=Duganella qianjiadongensis TaxID=2692176 RepID=A0ABW9VH38_9BURK|nr:hypothetical protein [Duganella qianjiadongensis]
MDRAFASTVPYLRNPATGEVIVSQQSKKSNNARTGWLLAGLALFFFVMVFVKRIWLS